MITSLQFAIIFVSWCIKATYMLITRRMHFMLQLGAPKQRDLFRIEWNITGFHAFSLSLPSKMAPQSKSSSSYSRLSVFLVLLFKMPMVWVLLLRLSQQLKLVNHSQSYREKFLFKLANFRRSTTCFTILHCHFLM